MVNKLFVKSPYPIMRILKEVIRYEIGQAIKITKI